MPCGAHEITDGAARTPHDMPTLAEVEQRVRHPAVATLVVEARQRDIVVLARQLRLGIDESLRHNEKRDALDAGNESAVGVRDLGEHEVHDILGEIVLAVRNPHLVALQAIARTQWIRRVVLAIRQCARHDVRETRPGLCFGETHGAGPSSRQLVAREDVFLYRGAVREDEIGVPRREHGAATEADAGLGKERIGRRFNHTRQLGPAVFRVLRGRDHAGVTIRLCGHIGRVGQPDTPIRVHARLFHVHHAVDRLEHFAGHPFTRVEHRSESVYRVIGMAGALGQRTDREPVVEQKVDGAAHGPSRL